MPLNAMNAKPWAYHDEGRPMNVAEVVAANAKRANEERLRNAEAVATALRKNGEDAVAHEDGTVTIAHRSAMDPRRPYYEAPSVPGAVDYAWFRVSSQRDGIERVSVRDHSDFAVPIFSVDSEDAIRRRAWTTFGEWKKQDASVMALAGERALGDLQAKFDDEFRRATETLPAWKPFHDHIEETNARIARECLGIARSIATNAPPVVPRTSIGSDSAPTKDQAAMHHRVSTPDGNSLAICIRPGQRWRIDGRLGDLVDVEPENGFGRAGRSTYVFRMVERDVVKKTIVHGDDSLPNHATFVSGPTEQETPHEEWDRVAALMLADRPEGTTESVWRAVVMDVGEADRSRRGLIGPNDAESLRRQCAVVRRAFVTAETAKKQWGKW